MAIFSEPADGSAQRWYRVRCDDCHKVAPRTRSGCPGEAGERARRRDGFDTRKRKDHQASQPLLWLCPDCRAKHDRLAASK